MNVTNQFISFFKQLSLEHMECFIFLPEKEF